MVWEAKKWFGSENLHNDLQGACLGIKNLTLPARSQQEARKPGSQEEASKKLGKGQEEARKRTGRGQANIQEANGPSHVLGSVGGLGSPTTGWCSAGKEGMSEGACTLSAGRGYEYGRMQKPGLLS